MTDELEKKLLEESTRKMEIDEDVNSFWMNRILSDRALSQHRATKKWIEELIDKWRVQLEDEGFISIDKHFVDDLLKQISGGNNGN